MSWIYPPPSNSHHLDVCIFIILYTLLVGNPYKSLFATVNLGPGVDPNHVISRTQFLAGLSDTHRNRSKELSICNLKCLISWGAAGRFAINPRG